MTDCNPEYISSIRLMILGEDLEPSLVSKLLQMRASSFWLKGTVRYKGPDKHEWSGWKKSLPPAMTNKPIENQLRYWVRILSKHKESLKQLSEAGNYCTLSIYIGSDSTVSIIVPSKLQAEVVALGLDLEISIFLEKSD